MRRVIIKKSDIDMYPTQSLIFDDYYNILRENNKKIKKNEKNKQFYRFYQAIISNLPTPISQR